MTPTLLGRWQTRILLFAVIGLPVTALYALAFVGADGRLPREPFLFLGLILAVGLVADVVYDRLQRLRWEGDWPFIFFVYFSVLEFLAAFGLMRADLIDVLPACRLARVLPGEGEVCEVYTIPFRLAAVQFGLVLVPMLIAVVGLVQVVLVRWRFDGCEVVRPVRKD